MFLKIHSLSSSPPSCLYIKYEAAAVNEFYLAKKGKWMCRTDLNIISLVNSSYHRQSSIMTKVYITNLIFIKFDPKPLTEPFSPIDFYRTGSDRHLVAFI